MLANAKLYISVVIAAGALAITYGASCSPFTHDLYRFLIYLTMSLLAATLKLRLPGMTGTMSIGFVFVLLGIAQLTLPETMLIACAGAAVQCVWRTKPRPAAIQVAFSVAAVALSLAPAYALAGLIRSRLHADSISLILAMVTALYFTANSLLVSGVIALVKQERFRNVWQQCYLFAFPYYLVGGVVAGMMTAAAHDFGWMPSLLLLPIMGMAFLFYRMYCARLLTFPVATAQTTSIHAVKSRSA